MSSPLLKPVCFERPFESRGDTPQITATSEANGLMSVFRRAFKNPTGNAVTDWHREAAEKNFYYNDNSALIAISDVNQIDEKNAFISQPYGVRYILSDDDLEKIKLTKELLHRRITPILERHGLKFWPETGGLDEAPEKSDGRIRWWIEGEKNRLKTMPGKKPAPFRVESSAGKIVLLNSGKAYERGPDAQFVFQLEHPTSHLDHFGIPASGIGKDLFLEEILAVLEGGIVNGLTFPNWQDRLNWFCDMLDKHQNVVFKPFAEEFLLAVFDFIRSRAVEVKENGKMESANYSILS